MSCIRELTTVAEWKAAFSVMQQLRTSLDEETYLELVEHAYKNEGYHLFAVFEQNEIVSVTGFMPMTTLYNGPSVWVCDLVTDEQHRSKGFGKQLLTFVEEWAADHGYAIVSLSSGLQRKDAHRFYHDKMNFDCSSYVFLKAVDR